MPPVTTAAAVLTAAAIAISPTAPLPDPVIPKGHFLKYGGYFPDGTHPLTIELAGVNEGWPVEEGGLGREGHFREAVNLLWGEDNDQKHFIWNPWSDQMLEYALQHKFLSVAGCASSGKSLFFAIYSIIMWLADPANTTVLITSTSLKESKGRIWADVEEWWNAAQRKFNNALPGKLVSSLGLIKLEDPTGEFKTSDRSGIHLIPGEKKKAKETIGKLIGFKNKRLIFIGDEMPELSQALIEAATGNLDSPEKELFQFVGIGNPNSIYDPHGVFSKPKAGWKSVTPGHFDWQTDLGWCLRFDAYQSPNVLAGRVVYKWLATSAKIEAKKDELGEDSLAFWRMWRGYWCPTGGTESVIAEADIVGFDCDKPVLRWKDGKFIWVAFLDPGFTNGGDRSVVYFARFGVNSDNGKETLEFVEFELLFEDTMNKTEARNFQIARKFKEACEAKNIPADHAACDDTGAAAFGDIVHTIWSRAVTRINFGGAPSKLQVSAHDKTLACDKYKNRVTEIWASCREYIRGDQVRGICRDLAVELIARQMTQKKSGLDLKAQVETKEKMKNRTGGVSPDIADAALGCLDFLRSKFRFRAAAKIGINATTNKNWKGFRMGIGKKMQLVGLNRSV